MEIGSLAKAPRCAAQASKVWPKRAQAINTAVKTENFLNAER